jgi:predicted MFS family arabinose efflux permease
MALAMTPAAFCALYLLREPYADEPAAPKPAVAPAPAEPVAELPNRTSAVARRSLYVALAFIMLITLRSATQQTFTTLLPKYFADQGIPLAVNGAMLFVLGLAGASGTFIGGFLGDRYNRRKIIFASMTAGAVFSFLMLYTSGWGYVAATLVAGIMMNIPHSILIIMAQRFIPARKGMMGGAVLGLMFLSGAVVAWLASIAADYVGLPLVLTVVALLPLGAGVCALTLPSTRGLETAPVLAPGQETGTEPAASAAG